MWSIITILVVGMFIFLRCLLHVLYVYLSTCPSYVCSTPLVTKLSLLVLLSVSYGKILNTVPISTEPSLLPKTKCPAAPSPIFQGTMPPYPTNTWWGDATVLPSTGYVLSLSLPLSYATSRLIVHYTPILMHL